MTSDVIARMTQIHIRRRSSGMSVCPCALIGQSLLGFVFWLIHTNPQLSATYSVGVIFLLIWIALHKGMHNHCFAYLCAYPPASNFFHLFNEAMLFFSRNDWTSSHVVVKRFCEMKPSLVVIGRSTRSLIFFQRGSVTPPIRANSIGVFGSRVP